MTETKSYTAPYELNKPLSGFGIAQVREKRGEERRRGETGEVGKLGVLVRNI